MLYNYTATTPEGEKSAGTIDAANMELAISSLQSRNLIIVSLRPAEKGEGFFFKNLKIFERVKFQDIVILSRQLSTLFEARVPVLEALKLLVNETENPVLRRNIAGVIDDIQGGISLSQAMAKYPNVFSKFYVSMVRAGEESGKLDEIFSFLADYLERSYEITSKAKKALIYPSFIISTFILVFIIMLVFVIPKLSTIITQTGQEIPAYTKIIIGISNFFKDFGPFLLIGLIIGIIFLWRYSKTEAGGVAVSCFQLSIPYVGGLYRKFYISRITDTLETCLSSGISMVRSLEIALDVVGNKVYMNILSDVIGDVKGGSSLSDSLIKFGEIPTVVSQMIKVGEESGKMSFTLKTLGRFYKREVDNSVDTIVSLIEPAMIIFLGLSIGFLLISILGPIYNVTSSI